MFGREFGQVPEVNEHPVHPLEGSVNTISTNPEQHSSQSPDGKIWSNADVTRVQLILDEEFDALCKKLYKVVQIQTIVRHITFVCHEFLAQLFQSSSAILIESTS